MTKKDKPLSPAPLRLRNGLPSKAWVTAQAEATAFVHHVLDSYGSYNPGSIYYNGSSTNIERAETFAQAVRAHGFEVEHRPYDRNAGRNGCVRIHPKAKETTGA